MIKTVLVGLWVCLVTAAASYAAAYWQAGGSSVVEGEEKASGPIIDGLEYHTAGPLTVPMISGGKLQGYVLAKVVFTADASALHDFPLDPEPFVIDEAFRTIYTDGKIKFDELDKYNLEDLKNKIKENVNLRFGTDLIQDVLVEEVNYVTKDKIGKLAEPPPAYVDDEKVPAAH